MLRIGDFSRLTRVTVKTLRFYDEAGLLAPAHVDAATGYRYYCAAQLPQLTRILALRDLGFGLEEIRRLSAEPADAGVLQAALRERRATLATQIAADEARLARLSAWLDVLRGDVAPPALHVRALAPVRAYTLRERLDDARPGALAELFETAEATVARHRARAEASPFLLCHDEQHPAAARDVEVCIPVVDAQAGLPGVREVEGHPQAGSLLFEGPYEQAPSLLAQLMTWIERCGAQVDGPLREVYHRYSADQRGYQLPRHRLAARAAELVTELQVPIRAVALSLLATLAASLPARAPAAEAEVHPGIVVERPVIRARDGTRLQAIVTRPMVTQPAAAGGRLPAVLYVQPLSCDSVAVTASERDGWNVMLRSLVRDSGALVWRTEKRGIGGSGGQCTSLDYDTELDDHRQALAALRARADIDARRIVVYGASMGGTQAPLLAAADDALAGVIVWGAGARTWLERTMVFERNALELKGAAPGSWAGEMAARHTFLQRYLVEARDPPAIRAADPQLGAVWERIVGTSATEHYGRPFAFHQQAQRANWVEAWTRVRVPVLALRGQYDWFEDPASVGLIGRVAAGSATVVELPGVDHHFSRYGSAKAAFDGKGGEVAADAAMQIILPWLRHLTSPIPSGTAPSSAPPRSAGSARPPP